MPQWFPSLTWEYVLKIQIFGLLFRAMNQVLSGGWDLILNTIPSFSVTLAQTTPDQCWFPRVHVLLLPGLKPCFVLLGRTHKAGGGRLLWKWCGGRHSGGKDTEPKVPGVITRGMGT